MFKNFDVGSLSFVVPEVDANIIKQNRQAVSDFFLERGSVSFLSDMDSGVAMLKYPFRPDQDFCKGIKPDLDALSISTGVSPDKYHAMVNRALTILVSTAGTFTAKKMWECIAKQESSLCIAFLDLDALVDGREARRLPSNEALSVNLRPSGSINFDQRKSA